MIDFKVISLSKLQKIEMFNLEDGEIIEVFERPNYGISFCISGQVTYNMPDVETVATEEIAVLFKKGISYTATCNKRSVICIIDFECGELDCEDIQSFYLNDSKSCLKDFEKIRGFFAFEKDTLECYSYFYKLLNKVFNNSFSVSTPLQAVVEYIEKNLSDVELSNVVLADKLCISEPYLRKRFSDIYNTSPKQYILERRIEKAKELLLEDKMSVSEIAEKTGFSCITVFSRAFKTKVGISPTEFLRKEKNSEILRK